MDAWWEWLEMLKDLLYFVLRLPCRIANRFCVTTFFSIYIYIYIAIVLMTDGRLSNENQMHVPQ
jgi:hypothetical protein